MDELVPEERGIYRIHARNFFIGAYTTALDPMAKGGMMLYGFIGIRQKFDAIFLSTELGLPLEKIGAIEDDRIMLWERYPGRICRFCGGTVTYHKALRNDWGLTAAPDGTVGIALTTPWLHDEPTSCSEAEATSRPTYAPLFDLLDEFEHPDS